ncbi:hypothetical protein DFH09DRAFT_1408097 [Mycena vulgaris]|nr:hypothetical protein DFH09DRAFT_1408097 [Mycena vulgaris]
MPSQAPPARLVAASQTFPANPHLLDPPTYQARTVAPSSAASSATTQTQKLLRNRLLRLGQFCAVTGSATATLQACNILNTVRKKKNETAEDARERKGAIESFLTNLGVLKRESFLLNSLFNVFLLKKDIHSIWAKHASIVFCPSIQTITQLTEYFNDCNYLWQGRAARDQAITSQRPYVEGGDSLRAFRFNLCPSSRQLSSSCMITAPSTWEAYYYDSTTSKLVLSGTTTPLTITIRHGDLSTVAVILNADAKIEHAQESGWRLSPEVLRLKKAIDSFKLELYFLPNLEGENSRPTASGDLDLTSNAIHRSTPKPSDDRRGDEELEEEDDDEASRSLSPEEYKLRLKKVVDPSIPIQERMAIGSLLLFKRHLPSPRAHGAV